jgi:FMN phosphatase YigB (HAD superfamily)
MTGAPRGWLIFDVDDTLVATFRTGFNKCVAAAGRLGLRPPTHTEFADVYGRWSFPECVQRLHSGVDVERYAAVYDSLTADHPAEPLCRLEPVLSEARAAGFGLGVLTNGPGVKTARKLAAVGVSSDDFDFVCHADNSRVAKPDPAAFYRLGQEFGVDPARAWYVSDAPADWAGSFRAGFGTIAVTAGLPNPRSGPVAPDLVVPDAGALHHLIGELATLADDPGRRRPGLLWATIFDAGFTVVEHVRSAEEIVADCLARRGFAVEPHRLADALAAAAPLLADTGRCWSSDAEIDRALTAFYCSVVIALTGRRIEEIVREVIDAYTSVDNWRERPGARAALATAGASGQYVAILANWQSSLTYVLSATGLADAVDLVVPSAKAGVGKPATAAFAAVADRLGVDLTEMAYVGDDPVTDIGGAMRAGCHAAFVPRTAPPDAIEAAVQVLCP